MPTEGLENRLGATEIGSLTASSPSESRFVGSSSGVFFVDTVRKAFATSFQSSNRIPDAAETVGGNDDSSQEEPFLTRKTLHIDVETGPISIITQSCLGILPPKDVARQLAVEYFRNWHPLFPFLSGPRFLEELDELYTDHTLFEQGERQLGRDEICKLIIFRCVFDIGAAHLGEAKLPAMYKTLAATELYAMVVPLTIRHDMVTIQVVLAAQLSCVVKMALRTASCLAGLLERLVTHSGLHRCPFRYDQLSNNDRDLRKRIFWSVYALDRYLSQALGLPVSMSDSDLDVCVPLAEEIHVPKRSALYSVQGHDPVHPTEQIIEECTSYRNSEEEEEHVPSRKLQRETVLANYIQHCRLVGRVLELYHKSIHVRSISLEKTLILRADIDHWFNNLPEDLQVMAFETLGSNGATATRSRFANFFGFLYQQLIILINRPSLSLPRTSPEFQSGLQIALNAARATLTALEQLEHLYWPGSLPAAWMSGLIIAFACQIKKYSISKGSREIARCARLLEKMRNQWPIAERCYIALRTLHEELQQKSSSWDQASTLLSDLWLHSDSSKKSADTAMSQHHMPSRKRPYSLSYNSSDQNLPPSRETNLPHNPSSIITSKNQWNLEHGPFDTFRPPITSAAHKRGLEGGSEATPVQKIGAADSFDIFQDISWETLFDCSNSYAGEFLNYGCMNS
ncbi:hypothetical protein M433DRAFT_150383 [Acidomyces richmondensis BFW]|nr:MAG: hypothetical protein FE78DRAFT_156374 [Acidomyces sp. 'richmondensis']KYG49123.1 hypothetical protein M433DRAFT_150383 [Acidomyces richmondensis BFW]